MKETVFHTNIGFQPYGSPEDSKYLLTLYAGLVREALNFKNDITDTERLNHLARLYSHLSGMLRILNEPINTDKCLSINPDFWQVKTVLYTVLARLSDVFNDWLNGNNFNTDVAISNLETMIKCVNSFLLIFDISTTTLTEIAVRSFNTKLNWIPPIILRYPILTNRGYKVEKLHKNPNRTDGFWVGYKGPKPLKRPKITRRHTKNRPPIDKAWLKCFDAMTEDYNALYKTER